MRILSNILELLLWLVIAFGMYYLTIYVFTPWGEFSQFPAAILRMMLGVGVLMFLDRVYYSEINTIQAIKNKNTAYSQVILAYAIIIAAVLMTI